jgi:hypothetical protein
MQIVNNAIDKHVNNVQRELPHLRAGYKEIAATNVKILRQT